MSEKFLKRNKGTEEVSASFEFFDLSQTWWIWTFWRFKAAGFSRKAHSQLHSCWAACLLNLILCIAKGLHLFYKNEIAVKFQMEGILSVGILSYIPRLSSILYYIVIWAINESKKCSCYNFPNAKRILIHEHCNLFEKHWNLILKLLDFDIIDEKHYFPRPLLKNLLLKMEMLMKWEREIELIWQTAFVIYKYIACWFASVFNSTVIYKVSYPCCTYP